ncbi:hypothetical protein MTR_4g122520 [Medicago truncatula]|uniref:Uncharacterized protein n=1 Tax=Medicago truncatula TaxID=3880 RepID=G7JNY6_MEDTR|nr:hypothetical protein MTR_4g122520 [Medicago truncatula]
MPFSIDESVQHQHVPSKIPPIVFSVTNFLNLPALDRRQPPYMVLRLCEDLCF